MFNYVYEAQLAAYSNTSAQTDRRSTHNIQCILQRCLKTLVSFLACSTAPLSPSITNEGCRTSHNRTCRLPAVTVTAVQRPVFEAASAMSHSIPEESGPTRPPASVAAEVGSGGGGVATG